jgi:hypothetical protein
MGKTVAGIMPRTLTGFTMAHLLSSNNRRFEKLPAQASQISGFSMKTFYGNGQGGINGETLLTKDFARECSGFGSGRFL